MTTRRRVRRLNNGTVPTNSTPRPLLVYLQGILGSLNPTERRIAEYVLKDPERALYQTISEMSRNSEASVGSIVGFCRNVGTRGFADLKIALARELAQGGMLSAENSADSEEGSLFDRVFQFHARSLAETRQINSEEILLRATDALENARCTYLFSTGLSYAVAYTAYCKLRLIGLPAHIDSDGHLQIVTASQLAKGDVAFGISCSGRTRETVSCLETARNHKALTICLTNSAQSPITQYADIALRASPSEIKYFQAPLASRVTQMAIVDALFESIAQRRKRETTKRLRTISERLMEHRLPQA
jgi:RpiR family transcriptional regulator, carbohydrate utilization regulator